MKLGFVRIVEDSARNNGSSIRRDVNRYPGSVSRARESFLPYKVSILVYFEHPRGDRRGREVFGTHDNEATVESRFDLGPYQKWEGSETWGPICLLPNNRTVGGQSQ